VSTVLEPAQKEKWLQDVHAFRERFTPPMPASDKKRLIRGGSAGLVQGDSLAGASGWLYTITDTSDTKSGSSRIGSKSCSASTRSR
jgi:hypothetical protein